MTSERALDWVDGFVLGLIRRAARRAPEPWSERLEEEWLADLAERRGRISRVRFAVGCCWATTVIAHDHSVAALHPAAGSPIGHGYLVGYMQGDPPLLSRRTVTFLLVACLHAAVLYGLVSGLTSKYAKIIPPPPFVTRVLEHPRSNLPPPPQPQVSRTRIEVPISEMPPIESPGDLVQGTPEEVQRPELPPSVPNPVKRVQGRPDIGFPSAEDFYPPAAIRMGEKGSATVRVCVDAKGRLVSEPTIVDSTGSPRLDEGALKLAKAGSGHYRATTEDGQPVSSCYPFRIRFDLRNN